MCENKELLCTFCTICHSQVQVVYLTNYVDQPLNDVLRAQFSHQRGHVIQLHFCPVRHDLNLPTLVCLMDTFVQTLLIITTSAMLVM
jgi:hypothetical protein